jgi:cell division protein ZapA
VSNVSQPNTATVKILDKEYQVACPEEQEAELIASAKYLDKQMRKIRDTGKVIGLERIAVMAALNISFELLQASRQSEEEELPEGSVKGLNRKLDDALYNLRQLQLN